MKRVGLSLVTATVVGAVAVLAQLGSGASASSLSNAEVVVFSGTGHGTFGGMSTAFGFSVSCQEPSTSKPIAGRCVGGAMAFTKLGLVKQVTGSLAESPEDNYTATVHSGDGSISCVLSNMPPITSGKSNTVNVNCSNPSGSGTSTNASIVVETGP